MSKSEISNNPTPTESEFTMTVSELIAILATLPDDAKVRINHRRIALHSPELFFSSDGNMLVFVPCGTQESADALERYYWRHLTSPAQD